MKNDHNHTQQQLASSMPDLTPRDFHRIQSVLDELVRESNFFPAAASDVDWFRPREEVDVGAVAIRIIPTATPNTNMIHKEKRRRVRAQSVDGRRSGSGGRTSLSSSSSSFIFARRQRCHSLDSIESSSMTETSIASLSTCSGGGSGGGVGHRQSLIEIFENVSTTMRKEAVTTEEEDFPNNDTAVSSIREDDVEPGKILGAGGFCEVRLASLRLRSTQKESSATQQQFYAMKYLIPPPDNSVCKVKGVNHVCNSSSLKKIVGANRNKRFVRGIADLAIEARFLALLSHDNIISLHYVSRGSFEEQYNSNHDHRWGFFLLLDPMFETLSKRIDGTYIPQVLNRPTTTAAAGGLVATMKSLRSRFPLNRQIRTHAFADNSDIRISQWNVWRMQLAQRLTVVKDIASALQYMHDGAHVICRDIKPDNIGFYRNPHPTCQCGWRSKQLPHPLSPTIVQDCICYDEVPKLFDFGLCKELKSKYLKAHPHHCPQDRVETYNLTARSGSRRYMAPEVARSLPYNEKADIYSFGILLYQMASLLKPFEGYTLVEHEEKVLCSGHRPNVEIPSAKGSSSSYSQWFAQSSDGKKKDLLELRTKCVWTEELKQLIEECWHFDMRLRPEMREVVLRLEGCIQELTCVKQVIASNNSNEVKRMSIQSKCVAKASRA